MSARSPTVKNRTTQLILQLNPPHQHAHVEGITVKLFHTIPRQLRVWGALEDMRGTTERDVDDLGNV